MVILENLREPSFEALMGDERSGSCSVPPCCLIQDYDIKNTQFSSCTVLVQGNISRRRKEKFFVFVGKSSIRRCQMSETFKAVGKCFIPS